MDKKTLNGLAGGFAGIEERPQVSWERLDATFHALHLVCSEMEGYTVDY